VEGVGKALDRAIEAIYDPVEGGFFRFAETRDWRIPHYEKMADLNAGAVLVLYRLGEVSSSAQRAEAGVRTTEYLQSTLYEPRLGTFLMTCMYQTSTIASAMFFYSSAANLLLGDLAREFAGIEVTWASWFIAGLAPGIVSSLAVPLLILRVVPPDIRHTPAAREFAQRELDRLGPIRGAEAIVLGVFVFLIGFWVLSSYVDWLSPGLVAFVGLGVLFVTGTLTWDAALGERSAWDVFVWYGGLLTLGGLLNETGVTVAFTAWVGGWFTGVPWIAVLVVALVIYFYTHYFFASTTVHALALYGPFVTLLVGVGAPAGIVVYSLLFLNNLQACLTHYGTTTSPVIFIEGYVSLRDWWRAGFFASVVNLVIWLAVGIAWWKVLGLW